MDRKLAAHVAWITGGGSGIGLACARELAEAGATVIVSGRRTDALDIAVAELGETSYALPLDVSDAQAVAEAAATIARQSGTIDILVNAAGTNVRDRQLSKLTPDVWRRIVDVNLNGAFNAVASVLPGMRERGGGTIVNIASWAAAFDVRVSGAAYSASKRGMIALSNGINMEECTHGIRACVICPAETATDIMRVRPKPPSDGELARMLQPADLGRTVRFVCEMPVHACINEIIMSPTWNRLYVGS
jgi:NADP-dependent 3-hydroxy acid dehydrogenase YdfG